MYIQLIGLGGLLKTPSIKIRRVLCVAIANSYDAACDAFIINGASCRITLEDVEHITGMPCDGKKHIPSNLDDNMELWKKLKDRNDTKITLKVLLAKMKGDSSPNFVRPFVLYTIGKYNPFNRWIKHHSVKATGSREPEEPRAFTDEDSHDGSFQKQQEVVDAAIDLMRHDEPTDTRDGQLVFIERVAGIIKLKRDGRIEKCYQDALAGIPETTQGTSYLKHDMVFLPTRSSNVHWFLVVVNPKRKEFRFLIHFSSV
ncbi:hypothetical protein ZWY2020_040874 [Hordeum vulgare]|nr:hypothetical protein ZWY2020_040874 [Hordeum vulgare]